MKFLMTETSVMDEIGSAAEKELGILEQYVTDSLPKLLDFAIDVILLALRHHKGARNKLRKRMHF